ncbi:MAG: DUF554 domain-containing protein [Hydrogenibacillus sp.]|nr:DUF554 domain-containing protein [Hydrogenibacillus sp.]
MALLGTIINSAAILVGAALGLVLGRLLAPLEETIMRGLGLAVIAIGLKMALETEDVLGLAASLAIGGAIGAAMGIERRMARFADRLGARFSQTGGSRLGEAFLTTTLIYITGSMSILGALESGLENDHHLLYMKAFLDGFTAILFAGTLGLGVALSAVPVFLYQGSIALAARMIVERLPQEALATVVQALNGVGGMLIVAIGLNLSAIGRFRVGDYLPALVIAVLWTLLRLSFA